MGTAAYMAPEQAEGKPVDARSDVVSFGAVLYEMATGHRAFSGDSQAATMAAVLHKEAKPPREIVPDVPAELDRVITRCLRKDPAKRQQHMTDVKVLLEELKEESESGKLGAVAVSKRCSGGRGSRLLRRSSLQPPVPHCGSPAISRKCRRAWLRSLPSLETRIILRFRRTAIRWSFPGMARSRTTGTFT